MLKADFHIHTLHSMDCRSTLEQVIQACQQKEINCIAIADHGSIQGALKMREIAPFQVVVAEEMLTTRGEIMGMFLEEQIPSGLSLPETIKRIKDQGGLLCAQHPFDRFRKDALNARIMNEIADQIDVVEIFNARNPLMSSSNRARRFARDHKLPGCVGSDAHTPAEIGNAYMEMPAFSDKKEFLDALREGKVCGGRANLLCHFSSLFARIGRILGG